MAAAWISLSASAGTTLYQHAHVVSGTGLNMTDASVLIVDGRIRALGAQVAAPADATIVDLKGHWITPALFGGIGSMGVVDISNEHATNDGSLNLGAVRPEFDPALAFNSDSEPVEIARVEGVGFALLAPDAGAHMNGGNVIDGLADVVTLDGSAPRAPSALVVEMGHEGAALAGDNRAAAFLLLADAFEEARHPPRAGEPRRMTEAGRNTLLQVLAGRLPVLFKVDRASDIRAVLKFAAQQKIRAIVSGGAEAWRVSKDLASAHVPVVIDPFEALPADFDRLATSLENGARLERAGVTVAFSLRGSAPHEARKLRQGAGNAVAHGMSWDKAFAAVTQTPAAMFASTPALGSITVGEKAQLIVWSGDPLEVTSLVEAEWLDGMPRTLTTRQTALRDRYYGKLREGAAR
jgi:hypothetical protein